MEVEEGTSDSVNSIRSPRLNHLNSSPIQFILLPWATDSQELVSTSTHLHHHRAAAAHQVPRCGTGAEPTQFDMRPLLPPSNSCSSPNL